MMTDFMKDRRHYCVFEPETGLMDAWYGSEEVAVQMVDKWDELRPQYKHFWLSTRTGFYIEDNKYLPVVKHTNSIVRAVDIPLRPERPPLH